MALSQVRQANAGQIVGVQPTNPPSDPIPVDIAVAPAFPFLTDPIDRAARLLGIIYGDVGQLAQRAVTRDLLVQLRNAGVEYDARLIRALVATDVLGVVDAVGNRMPSMDAAARPGYVDPIDRAVRLLGVVYGSQAAQLLQKAATFELITEDTGLHTNPERWLHENHWDNDAEVQIIAAGAAGAQNLGAAVAALHRRRIRELTIRSSCTVNTVVYLRALGTTFIKVSLDIPSQTTRVWISQDGREFDAAEQPQVYASDVTGGTIYVTAGGVEF